MNCIQSERSSCPSLCKDVRITGWKKTSMRHSSKLIVQKNVLPQDVPYTRYIYRTQHHLVTMTTSWFNHLLRPRFHVLIVWHTVRSRRRFHRYGEVPSRSLSRARQKSDRSASLLVRETKPAGFLNSLFPPDLRIANPDMQILSKRDRKVSCSHVPPAQ